jgi:glycine cleavage system H protein
MTTTVPAELRYTSSHEWARQNSDGTLTIGITEHAQHALGDIVFVDPPVAGRHMSAGEACAVVESVKAASDVYCPVAGVIVEGNPGLSAAPELVNSDPYGEGWLFRVQPTASSDWGGLLSSQAYAELLSTKSD